MKSKFTLHFILFASTLLFFSNIYGQTKEERKEIIKHYNIEKLESLKSFYDKRFKREQEEAMTFAQRNNIPVVIKKPNGGVAILQKITEDGTLIYYSTDNRGAGITTRTNELYEGGNLNIAVQGENMIIGVWDGGKVLDTHELLEGRVTQIDNATVLSDHATHVTGTLIGSEDPQNGDARGMAFEAEAWANDFNNDISEMVSLAAQGLLISNHSYGYSAEDLPQYFFGNYDSKAASFDNIAYNAPYYLIVSSAGNDRGAGYNPQDNGFDLLTDQGVSKNNLVVAAVNQVNNYTGPSSVVMSSFSSFGPTDDGRIKPDISAKGVNVFSSIASSTTSYSYLSGTSMATPNVAGSLLLLQQLHNNLYNGFMKSATLRGMVIHTASEAGTSAGPDYQFGWGLLNTEKAARVLLERGFRSDFEENTLVQTETYTKNVTAAGDVPLVVTIAWTDPAGPVQGNVEDSDIRRLVNDLDLRIQDEAGNYYFPWRLNPLVFYNAATQADNRTDNVEKIEIPNPVGEYTITVTHKQTLQDGAQDYSLIISGFQEGDFHFTPQELTTTVCDFEDVSLVFNFVSDDDFTGPTTFSVTGLPEAATSSFTPSSLTESGSFVLDISNLDGTTTGVYPITVTATGPSASEEIVIDLTIVNASPLPDIEITFPEDGAEEVFIFPTLTWTTVENAQFYEIEISTDPTFDSVFLSALLETNSYSVPGLSPSTLYYWRIRPINECVEGNYISRSFTTEITDCAAAVTATDTPVNIGMVPMTVTSVITIPAEETVTISDVNVTVDISHSFVGDFKLFLTSPSGTEVTLLSNACGDVENVSATFDDTGSVVECATTSPAISGIYQPIEPLNNFIGEESAGQWTLTLVDEFSGDGGALNSFQLEFCVSGTLGMVNNEIPDLLVYPNPSSDFVNISFPKAERHINVDIYDLKGSKIISQKFINNSPFFNRQINTSALSSGIYFIFINSGNQSSVKKLIVE